MDFRAVFLATWREIPDSIERQYLIENVLGHSDDAVAEKMRTQGSLLIHSFRYQTLGLRISIQSSYTCQSSNILSASVLEVL